MKTQVTYKQMLALIAVTAFSLLQTATAQNGVLIGPTAGTANASAMLEVAASNKGFLLPRVLVALTNGTTPINAPAPGLLVYNLGGGGVPAVGVYYWDGSAAAWVQLTAGGLSGSGTTNQVAKWTSSSAIGNSLIFDNATYVGVGNTNPAGMLDVKGSGNTSSTYGFGIRDNADTYNFIVDDAGTVTVKSLAGTGLRPVFADDNGTLTTAATGLINSYFAITAATNQAVTSTTPQVITGLSITLTPRSASSRFLITAVVNGSYTYVTSTLIYRDGAKVLSHSGNNNEPGSQATTFIGSSATDATHMRQQVINYMDAPNTASSVTYDVRITSGWDAARTTYVNDRSSGDMRTPSTLTILEFAQ